MEICLAGSCWLGEQVLATLASQHRILAVSAPQGDRLRSAAAARGIPVRPLGRLPPCDLLVAAHCHAFIGAATRARAQHGAIGYHPSLLPRHRGRSAVEWTLRTGDPIAGGSVYWLDEGLDTGDILTQDWCFVRPGDTPQTLWRRDLAPLGVRLLTQAVEAITRGTATRTSQDEKLATTEPPL